MSAFTEHQQSLLFRQLTFLYNNNSLSDVFSSEQSDESLRHVLEALGDRLFVLHFALFTGKKISNYSVDW